MPNNYTANMTLSNLITPTSLIYKGTELSTTLNNYLLLSGGTMTGVLNLTGVVNNPLYIRSTNASANNCIQIQNNGAPTAYIGVAGSAFGGNYANNFFIESASTSIIFNTNGRTSASTPNMIINSAGNVGIGVVSPSQIFQVGAGGRLRISNGTTDYSLLGTIDTDGGLNTRIVLSGNTRGFGFAGQIDYVATAGGSHIFSTTDSTTERMRIASNGNVSIAGNLNIGSSVASFNSGAISLNKNTIVAGDLKVGNGLANIHNGSPYAVIASFMSSGSLTIGGTNVNYGGGVSQWNSSTAGLLMECLDNTEIAVHDANNRVVSLMYYQGDTTNRITIGRNMGWSAISSVSINGNLVIQADKWVYSSDSDRQRIYFGTNNQTYYQGYGNTNDFTINHEFRNHDGTKIMHLDKGGNMILKGVLNCQFVTIANTSRDLTGIDIEGTNVGNTNNTTLFCIQGTFTGFHRVYTEDEKFNIEDPKKFKDDYEGRIVISTGKIATDTTDDNENRENTEWRILRDKEGITIEDALPMIELSRKRKDKRVFGVLGDKRRSNNRAERLIVNSVGEGAMWICNSNNNIENGDYIQSSDYLGYGERQDDDILHNYTCAKSTMSCDFQLDSPLYQCKEIDDLDENGNKLRVAFIACSYHCA
jgi:hypothetical protein